MIGVNEKPSINNFELKAIEIPDQLSFGQLAFTKYTNQIIRNRKELLSRGFINEDGDKIYPFKGIVISDDDPEQFLNLSLSLGE